MFFEIKLWSSSDTANAILKLTIGRVLGRAVSSVWSTFVLEGEWRVPLPSFDYPQSWEPGPQALEETWSHQVHLVGTSPPHPNSCSCWASIPPHPCLDSHLHRIASHSEGRGDLVLRFMKR